MKVTAFIRKTAAKNNITDQARVYFRIRDIGGVDIKAASELSINPNTIQRAYESLEAEGYVYSIPGKGSFAAPRTGVDEERRDRLLGQFDSLTAELLYLGVTRDRLIARIREKGGEVQ